MRILFLVALFGCSSRPDQKARCRAAAETSVTALVQRAKANMQQLDELAPRLRAVIEKRCSEDKWPATVIDCYAKTTAIDEMRACRAQLPVAQQDTLQRDETELMTGGGAAVPPGSAHRPAPQSPEPDKR